MASPFIRNQYPEVDDSIRFPVEDLEGDSLDEEEEEEEEEEEQTYFSKSNKNRKRSRIVNNFLDVEAEVEDDDAEEDDYVEEEGGFIAEEEEEEEIVDADVYRDRRAHRDLESRFAMQDESQLQNLAATFDARYQTPVRRQQRFPGTSMAQVPQSALLPSSTRDPKLWMLRCREGRERDLVHLLMRKALDTQRRHAENPMDKKWELHSALFRDDLKGFIYVEADTTRAVANALEGVTGLYMTKMTLVPVKEMPDVLFVKTVDKSEDLLSKQWVRIKRGKYQGDLARVMEVQGDSVEALVRLIPRLNLDDLDPNKRPTQREQQTAVPKRSRSGKPVAAATASSQNRPAQRLFNPRDLPDRIQRKLSRSNNGQLKLGGETFRDGYLEKWVRVTALDVQCAAPMLEEVERFMTTSAGAIDSETMKSLKRAVDMRDSEGAVFNAGDRVVVIEGELANVPATIKSIHNKIATIVPMERGMFRQTSIPTSQLRKHFVPGNAVKVISGRFAGRLGTVVAVDKNAVTFVDVAKHVEVQVFARDLADAKDQIVAKTELVGPLKLDSATLPGDRTSMGGPRLPRVPRAGPAGGGGGRRGGDPFLHAKVKVLSGQYKGFVGEAVASNRDGTAKVRLQANTRIITVNKAELATQDASGAYVRTGNPYTPTTPSSGTGGFGTPKTAWGGATPVRLGPGLVPGRTPNPYASAQTPNPYATGAQTPYHSSFGGSNEFDGSRTPAWDAGSKTPYQQAGGAWGTPVAATRGDEGWGTTPSYPANQGAWDEDPWTDVPDDPVPPPTAQSSAASTWNPVVGATPSGARTPGGTDWPRVGVVVVTSGGLEAAITSVDHASCTVDLDSGLRHVHVSTLAPVMPVKGDRAVTISGVRVGLVGSIIGLHEKDAIMCTEANTYETFPVDVLAKLK